jgi:DNA-binding transcriptional MerR regulator
VNWQTDPQSTLHPSDELGIGEVCERLGLSSRTVRYYEELGLLPGVRRRAGGRRVYGADELERIRFIQRLKTLGLTLQEIKELNALYALAGSTRAMLVRLDDLLVSHQAGLEQRISELIALRDEMRSYREHVSKRIESFETEIGTEMPERPAGHPDSDGPGSNPAGEVE